jgi:hypothetical protein
MKVLWMYETGVWSISALARVFRVSKNYVRGIVDPEYKARTKEANRLRNQTGRYYNREANTRKVRAHREYKIKLFSEMNPDLAIPRRKATKKPHRAVVVTRNADNTISLCTTFSQRSAALNAQKSGNIPGDTIVTTWNKLRTYRKLHPKAVFNFEL